MCFGFDFGRGFGPRWLLTSKQCLDHVRPNQTGDDGLATDGSVLLKVGGADEVGQRGVLVTLVARKGFVVVCAVEGLILGLVQVGGWIDSGFQNVGRTIGHAVNARGVAETLGGVGSTTKDGLVCGVVGSLEAVDPIGVEGESPVTEVEPLTLRLMFGNRMKRLVLIQGKGAQCSGDGC